MAETHEEGKLSALQCYVNNWYMTVPTVAIAFVHF